MRDHRSDTGVMPSRNTSARMSRASVSLGIVAGLAASVVSNRLLQSQLVGVSPFDPATIAGALMLLTIVAAMACSVPAQRAIRVNPVVALRQD
jgi:putative ABC transport system permease protein